MSRPLPKHRAREYETIFILHPESGTDAVDKVAGRCQGVIDKLEGKLLRAENWGRRRLAYPVRKQAKGIYIYLRYLGYQDMVHEIERNLRMLDTVIKYLTVKVDEDVDPAARPVKEEEISFIPKFDEDSHGKADEGLEAKAEGEPEQAEEEPEQAEEEPEQAEEEPEQAEEEPEQAEETTEETESEKQDEDEE